MFFFQGVPHVAGVVVTVFLQHQPLDLLAHTVGYPPRGRFPAIAVEQTYRSFHAIGADVSSKLPLRNGQFVRGF